jgi:hypothetical protein
MKLLHSRHAEYLLMSVIVPVGAMVAIWLMDMYIMDLRSPNVTSNHLIATTGALCIMMWWVLSIASLANVPGYGRYAFYIFLIPVWTIVVNSFLDNNYSTILGLDMEVLAVIGVTILTWIGSLLVCLIDWYQFNHREFTLAQGNLR